MNRKAALDVLFNDMPPAPDGTEAELAHYFDEDENPKLYGRRYVVPAGEILRMHVHTYPHFSIAIGEGTLVTDEESREIKPGDLIVVKAGVRHAYRAKTDTIWYCLHSLNQEEAKTLYGGHR